MPQPLFSPTSQTTLLTRVCISDLCTSIDNESVRVSERERQCSGRLLPVFYWSGLKFSGGVRMELLCEHRLPAYACPRCSSRSVGARCRSRQSFAPLVPARSCTCLPPAGRHGSRLAQAPGQFRFLHFRGFFIWESGAPGAPRVMVRGARQRRSSCHKLHGPARVCITVTWMLVAAHHLSCPCVTHRERAPLSSAVWWVLLPFLIRPRCGLLGLRFLLLQLVLFRVQCLFWLQQKVLFLVLSQFTTMEVSLVLVA